MHFTFLPFERGRLRVVGRHEAINGFAHSAGRGETGSTQGLACQDAKPNFDLVEPTGVGGRVVPVHSGVARPPTVALGLVRAEVVQDHMNFPIGVGGDHLIHKVQELPPSAPRVVARTHMPGADIESGEQGGGAVVEQGSASTAGAALSLPEFAGVSGALTVQSK